MGEIINLIIKKKEEIKEKKRRRPTYRLGL